MYLDYRHPTTWPSDGVNVCDKSPKVVGLGASALTDDEDVGVPPTYPSYSSLWGSTSLASPLQLLDLRHKTSVLHS